MSNGCTVKSRPLWSICRIAQPSARRDAQPPWLTTDLRSNVPSSGRPLSRAEEIRPPPVHRISSVIFVNGAGSGIAFDDNAPGDAAGGAGDDVDPVEVAAGNQDDDGRLGQAIASRRPRSGDTRPGRRYEGERAVGSPAFCPIEDIRSSRRGSERPTVSPASGVPCAMTTVPDVFPRAGISAMSMADLLAAGPGRRSAVGVAG
jgi:hypothetical protein